MKRCFCLALLALSLLHAEDFLRLDLSKLPSPALRNTWGDKPEATTSNAALPDGSALRLALRFGKETPKNLSYWTLTFPSPVPIHEDIETISFEAKANVSVSIKIPIAPFGFIYHGPRVPGDGKWHTVKVDKAYATLAAWCKGGKQDPNQGLVPGVIVAVADTKKGMAEIAIGNVLVTCAEGGASRIAAEQRRRRFRRVRASVVTLPWSAEGRSLETVLDRLDEAAAAGSDIVALPMECIATAGQPIPGPLSTAIAAKAKEHGIYVIGNLREKAEEKTYVTSFLCGRDGAILGTYRKSHKLPDEDMDLGDDLPVFETDFGTIAMRIGSDRYFADIDHVYTAKGARMIFWSQAPEPIEDEYLQDMPSAGRAMDYKVFIACSRYSRAEPGWITNKFTPYCGSPIGRSYIFNREGQRIASTPRKGAVATATIPISELQPKGRGPNPKSAFAALTSPLMLPPKRKWAKRRVRVTAIENHVGFADLLAKLDKAGKLGSDIVCTYEFVWVPVHGKAPDPERIRKLEAEGAERCRQVAAKAKQWNMYVLLCGILRKREINEGIVFDRQGKEQGRYIKIATTYPEQIPGTETPVFETDFGRIAIRICADNYMAEQDRSFGVKGADIVFFSTQDWGPDAIHRNLRAISRCMDAQMFHVQATHSGSETMHRSVIIDPGGVSVGRSAYWRGGILSAIIDLDNDRPRRFVRNYKPHKPGGYLPQYQPTQLPEKRNDLKWTLLAQRRPELYQALAPKPAK
ncbi:MAG: carbon-nitrogen hydrolase family protein [Victivallales bacterium]|nr:carbon-nitrogen hydrolase family protein [Victivallales bacterium]